MLLAAEVKLKMRSKLSRRCIAPPLDPEVLVRVITKCSLYDDQLNDLELLAYFEREELPHMMSWGYHTFNHSTRPEWDQLFEQALSSIKRQVVA
jgi:hypothetical protein